MRSQVIRIAVLVYLSVWSAAGSAAAQVKVYDKATGTWNEAPQALETVGDNSGIIMLYKPGAASCGRVPFPPCGADSKAIAAVEFKGSIKFLSTGIVTGEQSFLDLREFDPPNYDQRTPGKWQNIMKRELAQGRVVVTTDNGKIFTIYDLKGNNSGTIETGRVVSDLPKSETNK